VGTPPKTIIAYSSSFSDIWWTSEFHKIDRKY
jgi:hypothetical protein